MQPLIQRIGGAANGGTTNALTKYVVKQYTILRPKAGVFRLEAVYPAEGRKVKAEGRMLSHAAGGGMGRQRRRRRRVGANDLARSSPQKAFYWSLLIGRNGELR